MRQPLKVLIVEDSANDAVLMLDELRRAGFEPTSLRVETEVDFVRQLDGGFDLVLSDHQLPQFDGLRALELFHARGLEIPFIIVSGTISEEVALQAFQLGMADYLIKDRLSRLGVAVRRALEQQRLRAERKRTEDSLVAERSLLRTLIDLLPDAVYVKDALGRYLAANNACAVRLGQSAYAVLMGKTDADFLTPELATRIGRAEEGVLRGEALVNHEETFPGPGGAQHSVLSTKVPLRDAGGRIIGLVGIGRDITESKQLRDQLLRAQRMEAISTLAGGVAHDLYNILTPVVMGAELLIDKVTNERDRELVQTIQSSGARGRSVVRQLLTFSRGTDNRRGNVQVRYLLKEMVSIMRETFPREIAIEDFAVRELPPVVGDPTQLQQVFMNLCVHARDAMRGGGKLLLTASTQELGAADVEWHAGVRPGRHVVVSVTDTGEGYTPEDVARLFEPSLPASADAPGNNLGLWTVQTIVRSHHGFLTVASKRGRGTSIHVHLPAVPDAAEVDGFVETGALPRGSGELILVVDDEPPVRTATCLILERSGYRFLATADGLEALDTYRKHRDDVRLVLADVMMPVMGGASLIRALRAVEPALPILAMSGLTEPAVHNDLLAAGVNGILTKPCGARAVLDAIQVQLAR
ncbi:hybrid sensor histidine kinase/response regulator [Horticoccus sp. 23ND18S-11]|uniref:hybrid sensor histidine kinase/response regulator n=1 Tax=Horticoccus sp. 23ND18S-11 TaxID=3391832 RepID=UPI0039C8CCEF